MRRRDFIAAIASATAWPHAARAQHPTMVIGWLSNAPEARVPHLFAALRRGLADAGYVEGKNLTIEYRVYTQELLHEAVSDLVLRKVNVIFAIPPAVAAATNATTSIPIVAIDLEDDPVANGYVESLARPGGNITGIFLDIPELSGKQVGLLKEIIPHLSRVAILGVPGLNATQFAAAELSARALGLEAEIMEVRSADDFERAMEAASRKHVGAAILLSSPLAFLSFRKIGELALGKRLPVISLLAEFPRSGGLIAYGPNIGELWRRAGDYVGKILHGAKPGELPIQRPERFDLVINVKTAGALGVTVPPTLLATADEVVE